MKETKSFAPLILFVYNRPEHTKYNLEKLNSIDGVKDTELYIFSDAAKDKKTEVKVKQVRNYLDVFKENSSNFKKITIIKAAQNKGLANSIIEGVTNIIEKYEKVIVLEDDLEVSKDFLLYMNEALYYYQDKKKIWSISGYTFPMKSLEHYNHDIYVARRACSWGWATWSDRWNTIDWKVKDYTKNIKFNLRNRIEFGRWGRDMPFMLDENIYGLNHSWAIRWCYAAYKQNKYTIYPVKSHVVSNGTDGSGTNYKTIVHRYDTELVENTKVYMFEMVEPVKKIEREFRRTHKKVLGIVRDSIIWFFRKKGVIKIKNDV